MPAAKPNIVIIMADQLTAALTGAYGHPVVKTPALNRLCAEGVRFDQAYANCPLCAPARAAMLSGRYVSRTRTYDNAAILASDVPTFAHHLRIAGYETVASGKMHFIGADQLHGFEKRLTTDIFPSDFLWTPDWKQNEKGMENKKGREVEEAGVCKWSRQLDYDSEVHFRSLEFLRSRQQKDERPFCLLVSYTHPHPPYLITQEYWDMYEGMEIDTPEMTEDIRSCQTQMDRWLLEYEGVKGDVMNDTEKLRTLRRVYYGMVTYVDTLVGELLNTIDTLGMSDNTAVIFISDHGDMLCERQLIEKRCFYEWSIRVPLIARFPKRWQQGQTRPEQVSLIDIFPTLVDFTTAPAPINIDGQSFLNLLEDKPDKTERVVLSEYHGESVAGSSFMVRRGQYKYIYVHGYETQLFDLEKDPGETRNLSGKIELHDIESSLRKEIFRRFDPDKIVQDVYRSQAERMLMNKAMKKGTPTSWDYQPFFDASKSYTR